ncbi:laminin subunit beta-4 [Thalassophryne amazonica]|uniref:laminin subunit beta-4 n=1 Tax=Thalassophryne amazonica TaxID=390379 RepID=UPI0014708C57|nr:laminin subunit beta-4 [Thalassophryne amazonica]
MRRMEVDASVVQWCVDYLSHRPRFVRLQSCVSDTILSSTGAPQGTVLAPFLYTIYTADFKHNTSNCFLQKFSDDTAVVNLIQGQDEEEYRGTSGRRPPVQQVTEDRMPSKLQHVSAPPCPGGDHLEHLQSQAAGTEVQSDKSKAVKLKELTVLRETNMEWSYERELAGYSKLKDQCDDQGGMYSDEQKCFTCDSRLPYNRHSNPNSHLVKNIITMFEPERKMKWWQSENGVHRVSIQLDLETVFQFSHLVLTFKSFRPAAMLVERSKDYGRTWKVYRYFAEDCPLHFPEVSAHMADSVDDVICDSRYSGSEPSSEGEVVLKALDPIFEIEDPYAHHIQELITITNIRVNFTRLFTLGDTLLSRRRRNPQNKYYYALYDMVVRGSCFCNGHASECVPVDGGRGDVFSQPGVVHGHCVCQQNTAGENCERCQDFHHDSPWRPGGQAGPEICRWCNCHGHSDSCHFDSARYEATGGISGGVCDYCRHERVGPQCERCRPFLYQDPQRTREDPHACIPCDCDLSGSQGGGLCDSLSGLCLCKENVEGRCCDRCKYGFFGLRQDDPAGCQACRCHTVGSVGSCDQLTGSCHCDLYATGPLCDRCQEGFWGLLNSQLKCSPCDCDIGGARSHTCFPGNGQCECLPNMVGRRCDDPAHRHFLPALDYFLYEAEFAAPLEYQRPVLPTPNPLPAPSPPPASPLPPPSSPLLNPFVLPKCEQYFREQGYDFKFTNGRVVLVRQTLPQARHHRQNEQTSVPLEPGHALQIVPRQRTSGKLLTWTGPGFVRVQEGAGLRFTINNLPSSMNYQLVIRYQPEDSSDWLASLTVIPLSPGNSVCSSDPTGSQAVVLPGTSRSVILEIPLCLNEGGQYFVHVSLKKQLDSDRTLGSHILLDSIGLIPTIESVEDFCSQSDLESFRRFRCVGLAATLDPEESLPEVCQGLIKSLSARVHNGAVPCRCDAVGSLGPSCTKLGGFCDCKPNVIGRCCDTCAPLTFGFGPSGCKPCDCDPHGSLSELCDQVKGQCACRSQVEGRRCNRCQPGHWGFPQCRVCECNRQSEECDQQTGECQNCRDHTTGPNCDRCVEGYVGNPTSRQPCRPCLCPDILGSQRFFATFCQHDPESDSPACVCWKGHTGSRCDRCSPGFYGDLNLPGSRCDECPCNNNVDPNDRNACNDVTGECLHCLHNTTGLRCQNCKPGYYGDAVNRNCKECSCDRRGTEVTQCPLGSPCFCNSQTGQCPCRAGVTGVLCDQCEDGYWNMGGASGCQPCSCDPAHTFSNICHKVTGQCPCHPEFGGRRCDECAENHFGNPDLQCIPCDCNMEGTRRPSCDSETGECLCRDGVTGIFCDECAPGYESTFPSCASCHVCTSLWAANVTDVQHATQKMHTFLPRHGDISLGHRRHQEQILEMHSKLDGLTNLTGLCPPQVEKVETLCLKIMKLKDSIDPNRILIDPSSVLISEMNNIQDGFKRLLSHLKEKTAEEPQPSEDVKESMDEIQKLHQSFMSDEKRVRNAKKSVEDSMDTRQDVRDKLSMNSNRGELAPLDKKVQALSVANLNQIICGGPGVDNCSQSECGGALCRKCGGPKCQGVIPVSDKASETAKQAGDKLDALPYRLNASKKKINDVGQMTQDMKMLTKDLKDHINKNKDGLEQDITRIKELIKDVRDYLRDEMVLPEDIEQMAKAVLDIQLPRSPNQVQSLISDIKKVLSNALNFPEDLKNLQEHAKTAEELLQKAHDLREQTKGIDVTEINGDIYKAENAQDKANDDLHKASLNKDMTKDQIQSMVDMLDGTNSKFNRKHPKDLLTEIEAVKKKMELNREQAELAKDAADSALNSSTDAETQVKDVLKRFEVLKRNSSNLTLQDESSKRLNNITQEAETLRTRVEDKLRQIQDLENKIQQLLIRKQEKKAEVTTLLEMANDLRQNITKQTEDYVKC